MEGSYDEPGAQAYNEALGAVGSRESPWSGGASPAEAEYIFLSEVQIRCKCCAFLYPVNC